MATSSGNSSGSTQLANNNNNSGSEGEFQQQQQQQQGGVVDQRKRKRMESNRESARRSRMRKQKHLNDLVSQVTQLRKDNSQILTSINATTQRFLNVEAENSVLRAQMVELSHRLESLNGIIRYINGGASSSAAANNGDFPQFNHDDGYGISGPVDGFMNPLNNMMVHLNHQPILASPDFFQY